MFSSTGVRALLPLIVALLLTPSPGRAQFEEVVFLQTPYGLVGLLTPAARPSGQYPVVLVVSDRLGRDGREDPYVDLLLDAGIAVLVINPVDAEGVAISLDQALLRGIVRRAPHDQLDDDRIGLLGFGGGGRVVLTIPSPVPLAALYPSCPGLPPLIHDDGVLLLHPDDLAEASACQHVTPHSEAVMGATHGWDHGQGVWLGLTSMMPHPSGAPERMFSRSDPLATQAAADRVMRFFADAFGLRPHGYVGTSVKQAR